jgi:hypothetical protein
MCFNFFQVDTEEINLNIGKRWQSQNQTFLRQPGFALSCLGKARQVCREAKLQSATTARQCMQTQEAGVGHATLKMPGQFGMAEKAISSSSN